MFKTRPSHTTNLNLEEVISRLGKKGMVDGILLMGTTGEGTMRSYSDIDMVVVLSHPPINIFSALTSIDSKLGDVYFFTTNELDLILNSNNLDSASMEGKFVEWIKTGVISLDKSKRLQRLKEKNLATVVTDQQKYTAWMSPNFNLAHNKRLLRSNDPFYLEYLDMRLLFCIDELVMYYFLSRDMQWKGHKYALNYFMKNDRAMLDLYRKCLAETDRQKKFLLYEALVKLCTSGRIFDKNITTITLKDAYNQQNVEKALDLWDELVAE